MRSSPLSELIEAVFGGHMQVVDLASMLHVPSQGDRDIEIITEGREIVHGFTKLFRMDTTKIQEAIDRLLEHGAPIQGHIHQLKDCPHCTELFTTLKKTLDLLRVMQKNHGEQWHAITQAYIEKQDSNPKAAHAKQINKEREQHKQVLPKVPTLYPVEGGEVPTTPANGTDFHLAELYKLLGCDMIQVLELGGEQIMILDEEGKLRDKPYNMPATQIAWTFGVIGREDKIVGPVIICPTEMLQ